MDNFGIITLLPPIIIIVLALVTRRTFEALVIGGLVASVIAYGKGFLPGIWTLYMPQCRIPETSGLY